MKVTNWTKKLSAAIVAAGIWVPGLAYATSIPLGDPSFEVYNVTPYDGGFAYAQPIYGYAGAYRPPTTGGFAPSAWVDDLDNMPGYTQDDGHSNWIYDSAYGESSAAHRRAAPRTGNQAMHGLGHYSAQVTNAIFEANTTYTFSIWAQGDIDADGSSSGIFMYLFDGTVPFSDANSLSTHLFTVGTGDFANRGPRMSPAASQANWTQISLSLNVPPGAPEIGHPVGVGFFGRGDGAVDDATLTSTGVPEPSTIILVGMAGLSALGVRRRRE
jgi:PEP-CTERM motif